MIDVREILELIISNYGFEMMLIVVGILFLFYWIVILTKWI